LINLSKDDRLVKLYAINVDSNVVKYIEKGDVEAYINSPPMIVMEYLEGGTLMDLMEKPQLI
jgi:serine/threonine protein kinase